MDGELGSPNTPKIHGNRVIGIVVLEVAEPVLGLYEGMSMWLSKVWLRASGNPVTWSPVVFSSSHHGGAFMGGGWERVGPYDGGQRLYTPVGGQSLFIALFNDLSHS